MWFKSFRRRTQFDQWPTEEDFRKADALAEELRKSLPTEFILGARKAREGEIQYPDLHFIADPKVPGLFRAKVDPDFIMGRSSKSRI